MRYVWKELILAPAEKTNYILLCKNKYKKSDYIHYTEWTIHCRWKWIDDIHVNKWVPTKDKKFLCESFLCLYWEFLLHTTRTLDNQTMYPG